MSLMDNKIIFVPQTLFLPGDNDIGGEDELVTESKVSRFQKYFKPLNSVSVGHIQFLQVGLPSATVVHHTYKTDCTT